MFFIFIVIIVIISLFFNGFTWCLVVCALGGAMLFVICLCGCFVFWFL